jgi:predicted KAP-like P-loop ATPase
MIAEEINPIDFIGLEALRIFIPEIYSAIANDKSLFTQATSLVGGERRNQEELRNRLDYTFSQADEAVREAGKSICFQLFPKVSRVYEPLFSGDYRQTDWRQARRICSEDVFDFYFVLGTPEGEISRAELEIISQTADRPEELLQIFRKMIPEGRAARLLDLLSDNRDNLDHKHALGLCQALLVLGDEMPNEHRGPLLIDTDFHLAFELYQTLQKVDQTERCQWFEDQIRTQQAIYMPVYVLGQDSTQEGKPRN